MFGVYFSHMIYFIPVKISSERICDGYVPIIVQRKAISVLYLISCKGFCFCLNMSLTRKWEVLLHCLANNHSNEAALLLELKFWQGEGTDTNNHRSTTCTSWGKYCLGKLNTPLRVMGGTVSRVYSAKYFLNKYCKVK